MFYLQIFPEFLRRLQTISDDKYHPRARQELLEALALSVANNPATLKHWQQMYLTYLPASAELLEYLGKFYLSSLTLQSKSFFYPSPWFIFSLLIVHSTFFHL